MDGPRTGEAGMPRALVACVLVTLLLAPRASARDDPPFVEGEAVARVSVTVDPDGRGTVAVPGPFTVVPGSGRVAIHVPEAGGVFVLAGDSIVHYFELPAGSVVHDIQATGELLAVGWRVPPSRNDTVEIHVFDLKTGQHIERIRSANPYLRIGANAGEELWRVVVEGGTVGVYHPPSAASFPLWNRETGPVPGSEQMSRARAGVGFEDAVWVPHPDGTVDRKVRGRTEPFSGLGEGEFIDGPTATIAVLLQAAPGDPPGGERELPEELVVHVLEKDVAISTQRLSAVGADAVPARRVVAGRPVRAIGRRLYWIHLGHDYVEVRMAPLPGPVESPE